MIEKNSEIFSQFSIIIATELPEKSVLKLGEICWNFGIPLVVARCYGLFGYLRVVSSEHAVVESHPDNPVEDLRLDAPLSEVQKLADQLDFSTLDSKAKKHVPFLLILLKASKLWKDSVSIAERTSNSCTGSHPFVECVEQHNNELPKNSADKEAFRDLIRGLGELGSENVDEAVTNAHRAWLKTTV